MKANAGIKAEGNKRSKSTRASTFTPCHSTPYLITPQQNVPLIPTIFLPYRNQLLQIQFGALAQAQATPSSRDRIWTTGVYGMKKTNLNPQLPNFIRMALGLLPCHRITYSPILRNAIVSPRPAHRPHHILSRTELKPHSSSQPHVQDQS